MKQKCIFTEYNLRSIFIFLIITLSIIGSVSPVFSEPSYIVLKGGIYTPTSNDLKGFGTGLNGEVALGHYFNPYFATELGVGYYQSSLSQSESGAIGDASFSGGANLDLRVIPATLSLKALYPMQRFEPYVMGGLGAYFANAKLTYNGTFTSGGATVNDSGSTSASATTLGWFLGFGTNFYFNQYWYIGVEGKYLWTRPSFTFDGTDVKINMDGWTATGNVGYRF